MSGRNDWLQRELGRLIQAVQEQTKAIQSLADSNALLVQAMAEADIEEDDGVPIRYLDGSQVL